MKAQGITKDSEGWLMMAGWLELFLDRYGNFASIQECFYTQLALHVLFYS
jgi:hypothetical protein